MADLIKVTFSDGEEICFKRPVNTVVATLQKIGADRFPEITMTIRRRPLVSQEIYPELKKFIKEVVPGWYYITQSDTREKTSQLLNIDRMLNLGLKIEVSSDFKGAPNPKIEGVTKRKSRLIVTLPDEEVIDYDSYKDVFTACIDKIGPSRVMHNANFGLSKNRPLITVTNIDGKRIKVGDFMYLTIPDTVKDAKKTLDLVGKRLNINLITEVVKSSTKRNDNE